MSTQKIPFRTAYGEHERYYCPTGDGMQEVWEYTINKYGQKEITLTGHTDLYAKIQESLEETKIENILARVVAGDQTVLRPDGIYEDITEAPKSLLEARQQMQKLENVWNGLSNDIKKKYDMSVEKFINESGSEHWLIDMGLLEKKEVSNEPATKSETTTGGDKQ